MLLYFCSHIYLCSVSKLNILQPHGIRHVKLLMKLDGVVICLVSQSLAGLDNQRIPPVTAKRQQ